METRFLYLKKRNFREFWFPGFGHGLNFLSTFYLFYLYYYLLFIFDVYILLLKILICIWKTRKMINDKLLFKNSFRIPRSQSWIPRNFRFKNCESRIHFRENFFPYYSVISNESLISIHSSSSFLEARIQQ